MNKKIFVLGDSKTGTTSIHGLFRRLNFKSIHYYVEEAGIQMPIHSFKESNWKLLEKYYEASGYNAFSDYPTRAFWLNIYEKYPDAFFILSVRQSAEVWRNSAAIYFAKRGTEVNLEKWQKDHVRINGEIEDHFAGIPNANFLKIVIDDGTDNGSKIKSFLAVESDAKLEILNAASPNEYRDSDTYLPAQS